MFNDIKAVKDFECLINYNQKEGTLVNLYVEAIVNSKKVYAEKTDCSISYNFGYEQYDINVDWNISDEIMTNLGLHGSYNTNFQRMEFKNSKLIVYGSDYEICFSKEN